MPELPEVEHARRALGRWLRGRRVERAEADRTRVLRGAAPAAVARALAGRKLVRAERRGKLLALVFDGDIIALSHLGMTGKWVRRAEGAPASHSRVRLFVDDGNVLHYRDPRMFGRFGVVRAADVDSIPEVRDLGPDPLRDGVDPEHLAQAFARTSRSIKLSLMDQRILAGLGNIQTTEALFRARVHPARPARSLSSREICAVADGVEASIAHTLAGMRGGEVTYTSEDASANPFLIYDRAGDPCPRCRTRLEKLTIGGRTTAFCPRCQPRGKP